MGVELEEELVSHVRGWAPHEEAVPPRGRRAVGTRVRTGGRREEKICNVPVAASLQPDLDTSQPLFPAASPKLMSCALSPPSARHCG